MGGCIRDQFSDWFRALHDDGDALRCGSVSDQFLRLRLLGPSALQALVRVPRDLSASHLPSP